MLDLINKVAEGRWFKEPSPFRCQVQPAHEKLCIITGPNTCGKSLLRKILHAKYSEAKQKYIHISQEGRGNTHGLARVAIYGDEQEDSTGYNSIRMFIQAIKSCQGYTDPFGLMFDEPEIGCSEEIQSSLGLRLVNQLDTMPHCLGVFVVTHSREFVRSVLPINPTHWRLDEDGMTLQQFVERPVVPADLERVIDLGHERWREVSAMLKAAKTPAGKS